MHLVLDHAVPESAALDLAQQHERLRGRRRHRLFAIVVLARGDRLLENRNPLLRRSRIEQDRVGGVGKRRVKIGRPIRELVVACDCGQALGVAADKQQAWQQTVLLQREPAFGDDRD